MCKVDLPGSTVTIASSKNWNIHWSLLILRQVPFQGSQMASWQPASLTASRLGRVRPLPTASLHFVFRDLFWHHLLPDRPSFLGKESHLDGARSCTVSEQSLSLLLIEQLSTRCFLSLQPSVTLHSVPGFTSLDSREIWLHIKISLG